MSDLNKYWLENGREIEIRCQIVDDDRFNPIGRKIGDGTDGNISLTAVCMPPRWRLDDVWTFVFLVYKRKDEPGGNEGALKGLHPDNPKRARLEHRTPRDYYISRSMGAWLEGLRDPVQAQDETEAVRAWAEAASEPLFEVAGYKQFDVFVGDKEDADKNRDFKPHPVFVYENPQGTIKTGFFPFIDPEDRK